MFALGLLLLSAALWVVAMQGEALALAWQNAHTAPSWMLASLLALPLVNWLLTSVVFWTLTRAYGTVGFGEMAALMGSAWLLNMLPMKPGLAGRVAYHKAISGISVATSLGVLVTALACGGIGIVIACAIALMIEPGLISRLPGHGVVLAIGVVALGVAMPVGVLMLQRYRSRVSVSAGIGRVAICVGVRVIETFVWALRYWLIFRLIGQEQSFGVCTLIAGASQLAGQVPIQLGLREWAVGLSSAALTPGTSAVPGLTCDLINRACEIAAALPVGLISAAWVFRKMRRVQQQTTPE
jgi:hypothetical protein